MTIQLNNLWRILFSCFVQGGGVLCSFLMTVLVARHSDLELSASIFFGVFIGIFVGTIGSLGFFQSILKYYSLDQIYIESHAKVLVGVFLFSSVFAVFTGWLLPYIGQDHDLALHWSFYAVIPAYAICYINAASFRALGMQTTSMLFLSFILPFIALVTAFTCSHDLSLFAPVYTGLSILTALGSIYLWWKKFGLKWTFIPSDLMYTTKQLFLVLVANQAMLYGAQLLSGVLLSAEDVAIFMVANRLVLVSGLVLLAVNMMSAPTFSKLYKNNELQALCVYAKKTTVLTLVIGMPYLILLVVFPDWLLSFFGEQYVPYSWVVRILAVAAFINLATGSSGYLMIMSGLEKEYRNIVLITAILSMLILVPAMYFENLLGAAVGTIVPILLCKASSLVYLKRHLGFTTLVSRVSLLK